MSQTPRATVHLSNIVSNWQALGRLCTGAEVGAAVKADAYGHGGAAVAQALAKAGCRSFFVAYSEAGGEIRAAAPDADIYILNGADESDVDLVQAHRLSPVLNTLDQVRLYRAAGLKDIAPAALHFDTGINRLGLRPEDAFCVFEMLDGRPVGLVMSHLACADEPDHPLNAEQLKQFEQLASYWPDARRSLANTAGCYLGPDYHFDQVRPGIGLYGGGPKPPPNCKLKPGLTLEAPILALFEAKPGTHTGYGATYAMKKPRHLATLAFGYADGLLRTASNSGFGVLNGQRAPIAGRVSMDLVTLDVTDISGAIAPGMMVEFLGTNAHLEDQAAAAGTIGYELTTRLGPRVERITET